MMEILEFMEKVIEERIKKTDKQISFNRGLLFGFLSGFISLGLIVFIILLVIK